MKKESQMDEHRKKVTAIDRTLMKLLAQRLELAEKIGTYKRERELPIEDPHIEMKKRKERQALARLLKANSRDIETIFSTIVKVARQVQRRSAHESKSTKTEKGMTRVAIMGSQGSFTEEAALAYLKREEISKFELLYPVSAEGVLLALERDEADVGIFPIHNSTGGVVTESIYAASEHQFFIEDMFDVDIRQCLMVRPGTKPEQIIKIMSHQQALAQCRGYINKHFPNAEIVEASDTATSAKFLGSSPKEPHTAVIAPKRCAGLYGLTLLEEGIQDQKNNLTKFIAARV